MQSISILGSGPSYKECPFDSEIWGVNNVYKKAYEMGGYVDKLFLAHKPPEPNIDWEEIEDLSHSVEIVSLHPLDMETTSYPYDEIVDKFGSNYFTNTISYMLAYALYLGYKEISLYGVDMGPEDIYRMDIGGVEFWIGYAVGMKVKVNFSEGSYLCNREIPYGFD